MNLIVRLFIKYALTRLAEASTWRGLALLGTSIGITLDPSQIEAFVAIGLAVSGFVGVSMPDKT